MIIIISYIDTRYTVNTRLQNDNRLHGKHFNLS